MSDRIEVSPSALQFIVAEGKSLGTQRLLLRNPSGSQLCAFKVRATEPQAIHVSQRRGLVRPRQALELSVQVDVRKIVPTKQPKLEIRHRFAGEGLLMLPVEELERSVDEGQCDSTIVQCTIERRQVSPVAPSRSTPPRDAQAPPPKLEPAMLELLIKNVTRNAKLEPTEILSLRTLRSTVTPQEWQEWLVEARVARDARARIQADAPRPLEPVPPPRRVTPGVNATASHTPQPAPRVQFNPVPLQRKPASEMPPTPPPIQFELVRERKEAPDIPDAPAPIQFTLFSERRTPGAPVVLQRKQLTPQQAAMVSEVAPVKRRTQRRVDNPVPEPPKAAPGLKKWCLVVSGKAAPTPSEASILRKRSMPGAENGTADGVSGSGGLTPGAARSVEDNADLFLGSTLKIDHGRSRLLVTRPMRFTIPRTPRELKPFQFNAVFAGYNAGQMLIERFRNQVHAAVAAASVATLIMVGTATTATSLLEGQTAGEGILSRIVNDLLLFPQIYPTSGLRGEQLTVKMQALEIDANGCRDLLGRHEIVSDSLYRCRRDASGACYITQAMSIRINTLLEFERVMGVMLARRQQLSEEQESPNGAGDAFDFAPTQPRHLLTVLTATAEKSRRTARIYILQCAPVFPLMRTIETDLSGHPWGDLTVIASMLHSFPVPCPPEITRCSRVASLLEDALNSDAEVAVVGLLDTVALSDACRSLQALAGGFAKQFEPQYLMLRILERMLNFCANFTTQHVD